MLYSSFDSSSYCIVHNSLYCYSGGTLLIYYNTNLDFHLKFDLISETEPKTLIAFDNEHIQQKPLEASLSRVYTNFEGVRLLTLVSDTSPNVYFSTYLMGLIRSVNLFKLLGRIYFFQKKYLTLESCVTCTVGAFMSVEPLV